jgi:glycopeptide antibiotics resistance protein
VSLRRGLAWAAVLLVIAWLLSMTLRPGHAGHYLHVVPFSEKLVAFQCLLARCAWGDSAARFLFIDVAGNIAVFVPFGAALAFAMSAAPLTRRQWLQLASAGLALSAGIEIAQFAVPGRVTDIDDVILNVLGTLIGGALMSALLYLMRFLKT